MGNLIGISTGLVYKLTNDRNSMISKLREFSPDGIELSFAKPDYLFRFKITAENQSYLKSLKFVTIHAPWKDISYGKNEKCYKTLKAIEELYCKINAENVVFHPEQIKDYNVFKRYNFRSSIENEDWRRKANNVKSIGELLDKNPDIWLVFDFAHALTVSSEEIPDYINRFRHRISEIHLAMLNNDLKDHWFLHKYDCQKIRELMENLKGIDVPIVLECVASNDGELNLIKKEIKYIKENLN